MNTVDAAHATVHDYPGGSESLGPRVGISPAVLRNKVNPHNTTHHLTLAEAKRLVLVTGDIRILRAWANEAGFLLVKAPDSVTVESDMSVLEHMTSMLVAQGHFAQEIHTALSDGGLTQAEMKKIELVGQDFMSEVVEIQQRLRGMVG